MFIVGNGVDIVENKRIEKSLKIKGFVNRIFTKQEINKSKKLSNKINYFSKRFAAKEAFVKAIGVGFRENIKFSDIEIINDKKGMPKYAENKKIIKIVKKKYKIKKFNSFLSISDEKDYSTAFAIIQSI